ncbi:hypothetical protein DFP94_101189 [Fontibacillus phaseoli]|uniref:Uncharacterized protein n=1 Tax=Fontibacillus phaseoli TaxID=1416533 RepID=A0A369BLY2_9BACL|nr:hypothetical protein [Fontibacillus phaseoli]RCX22609.1 hypothetical protein DFP94_101189 [Fontibacillus phaseoli]
MAKKEILGLEIEVDSDEVDKTDKKLRSLDKLLQQTQRRAAVLGKTKIAPKITLDDRFTSAAEKVKRTLTQIQRTKVRPMVHLVDNVTAAAARIKGSLIGLSMRPWRVSVEAVDWDGVVGGSFDNWISAEGQGTLQKISSSIGTALGSGLKDVMMGALGLAESPKEMVPKRRIDFAEEDRKLLMDKEESPYAEAGRKAGESFFQAFLEILDPNQIMQRINLRWVANLEGSQKGLGGVTGEKKNGIKSIPEKISSVQKWIAGFLDDMSFEAIKGKGDKILKEKIPQFTNTVKDYWENIKKKPSEIWKYLEPATGWVKGSAWPFLKNNGSKLIKKLKFGYLSTPIDIAEFATAKTDRERAEKIGGMIGGAVGGGLGVFFGSGLPGVGNVLLGLALSVAGDRAGELIGGGLYDVFTSEHEPTVYSDRVMAPGVQGVTRPEKPQRYIMGTPVPDPVVEKKITSPKVQIPSLMIDPFQSYLDLYEPKKYESPMEQFEKFRNDTFGFPIGVQPPDSEATGKKEVSINVSFAEGAIKLNSNKDELNIEELSIITAQLMANQMRLKLQNMG